MTERLCFGNLEQIARVKADRAALERTEEAEVNGGGWYRVNISIEGDFSEKIFFDEEPDEEDFDVADYLSDCDITVEFIKIQENKP